MSESTPPEKPKIAPAIVRRRWQRASIYAGSVAVVLAMWICGLLLAIQEHPDRFVNQLLAQLPFPASTGTVSWENRRTLRIDNLKLGDFFYADSVIVTASPLGLLRRHVAKVRINGGQLFTKALYAAMDKISGKSDGPGLDWVIARLEIHRGMLMLDNLVVDTPIPIRLGARDAIVLNGIRLGKPDNSVDMTKERTMEIVNVNIVSPWDPVAPVMSFPLTRLHFTYTELWHHHIRGIEMIRPTLHLGQDLFWFTSEFKKERQSAPAEGPASPWVVEHLRIDYGRLAVNAFGQPVFHFPFFFGTTVDDIRLDQLDKISAKSVIAIQRLDQDYPDYKVRIAGLTGRLYFSVPPTDEKANNVVNTISIEELSWNDIPVKGVSSTVTFDPNGVYGKLNGACEGGQMTGNFEFYYTKGFTWNANFFADKINLQPIAEKMGGAHFDLTGELDGKLAVQGKVTDILNCQGTLTLPRPGVLQIKSMDELLKRLPVDVSSLKRDIAKIAVTTFQTYPYQSGFLNIAYTPAGGLGTLQLDSPLGQRKFEMAWHPYESSKVAKNADTQ